MITHAALSDPGLVRESNQDRLFTDPDHGIYLVADGMGGLSRGDLAAQLVIDHLPGLLVRRLRGISDLGGDLAQRAMSSAIIEVSTTVRNHQIGPQGMGATVVLAYMRDSMALIAWLGDSRAYLFHQKRLQRLTTDHCLAELLIQSGDLTPEQAVTHPTRTQLTRYVGMHGHPEPETRAIPLAPSDRLLLCTDGVTTMIGDKDIEKILQNHPHPEEACRELTTTANTAGGTDNLTVITIERC